MTATDVITSALLMLGALDPGEGPSPSELSDGLARLNNMLDSWGLERLNIFTVGVASYALSAGTATYSIGAGQAFNGPRPVKIESANVTMTSPAGTVLRFPLALLDQKSWAALQLRGISGTVGKALYYDHGFPYGQISIWPTPASYRNLELFTWTQLSQFADLTTDLQFPPGYERALRMNLALEIAAEYATQPKPTLVASANESKAAIRALNGAVPKAEPPAGVLDALPGSGQTAA